MEMERRKQTRRMGLSVPHPMVLKNITDSEGNNVNVGITQVKMSSFSESMFEGLPKRVPKSFNAHTIIAGAKIILDYLKSMKSCIGEGIPSEILQNIIKTLNSPKDIMPLVKEIVLANVSHRVEYNTKKSEKDPSFPVKMGLRDLVANYEVSDLMKEFGVDCQFLRYNKYPIIDQATGELYERMEKEEKRFGGSVINWFVDINFDKTKGESEFIIDTPMLSSLQTPEEFIEDARKHKLPYKLFVLDENGHFGLGFLFRTEGDGKHFLILFDTTMSEIQISNKIVDVALQVGMCSLLAKE